MQRESLDVFDFDGTLVTVNSFREITKRFLVVLLKKLQVIGFLKGVGCYILRRIGIISHLEFKRRIVDIFEKYLAEREKQCICRAVFDENVNKAVLERMANLDDCVICTAAPFAYISRMSLNKHIAIISSLESGDRFPEPGNLGAAKLKNLKVYFNGENFRIVNFFTDSSGDDQALIDISDNAFIVQGDTITRVK